MPAWLSWSAMDQWVLPLAFIVAGALLGLGLERLIFPRLRKLTERTQRHWDDVLLHSMRRAPTILFTALGASAAANLLPLTPRVRSLLSDGLMILIVFTLTLFVARATGEAIKRWARRTGTFMAGSGLVTMIAKLVIMVLGLLLILQNLGISIGPILGAIGIGSLAVALALQPTLANAFAGFQILATRQVRNGDYIRLESGEEGHVVDIRWRNTTIKARLDDHFVIVPNSTLIDSILVNYNLPRRPTWLRVRVGVSYESDLERVEQVALEVAREVWKEFSSTDATEEPAVRYKEFGDSAITLQARIMTNEFDDQSRVQHEFIKRLHRRFAEEGIVIPWPIRTLDIPDAVRVVVDGRSEGDGLQSARGLRPPPIRREQPDAIEP
ncbi:MAG: mechanosensitive ion channel family protein [Gemmatimonadota bacterium]